MTKLKSKKMTKSTLALIIMAVAMVAMLAFGGTYAYFTATATPSTASAKTATIQLTAGSNVVTTQKFVVHGDQILGEVTYNPAGTTTKSIVIVHYEVTGFTSTPDTSVWKNVTDHDNYYYQIVNVTESGEGSSATATVTGFTNKFVDAVTFSSGSDYKQGQEKPTDMGVDITVSIAARSIQYRNLADDDATEAEVVAAAWTALYGN